MSYVAICVYQGMSHTYFVVGGWFKGDAFVFAWQLETDSDTTFTSNLLFPFVLCNLQEPVFDILVPRDFSDHVLD